MCSHTPIPDSISGPEGSEVCEVDVLSSQEMFSAVKLLTLLSHSSSPVQLLVRSRLAPSSRRIRLVDLIVDLAT